MSTKMLYFSLLIFGGGLLSCTPGSQVAVNEEVPLKTMIGQMIMVGFNGMEVEEISKPFLEQVDSGYVGGVILFDYDVVKKKSVRNIASPEQVKRLISGLQDHSSIPLFVAVDQEGGKVNRLKAKYGFPTSVTSKYLGTIDDLDSTRYYALSSARTLSDMGFNINFAPVVDIDINAANPVIGHYERSYGDRAELVVKHASEWIETHDSLGIISTLKHFPGHGSSDADSHQGITDVTPYWQEEELVPFKKLGQSHSNTAIMTAHVVNHQLDTLYPATLSKTVISGILREKWNFDGLLFSDDLQMGAINDLYEFEQILNLSINAGVDILVFGNNLQYDETIPKRAVEVIISLVEKGEISKQRIKESYERIMRYK